MPRLTEADLPTACAWLAARDADLAAVYERLGVPPLWARPPGFATLLHIILEQQVSLASARAAFERLCAVADPLTPERFLALSDATLRTVGFSRQKTRYARGLAEALHTGRLDLQTLASLPDAEARARLVALKGIGPWTADVYLLMALGRPDVWPVGDRALVVALRHLKALPADPTPDVMASLAEPWRPWRAAAARLLWHHYLHPPARSL